MNQEDVFEEQIETPEPGIYTDVEDKYYRAWDAVSITTAFYLTESPGHYQHRLRNPPEETDAMRFGTNFHTRLLQPDLWDRVSVVMPDFATGLCDEKGKPYSNPRASKAYKSLVANFEAENRGRVIVSPDEYLKLEMMANAVTRRDIAGGLIRGEGAAELSILARDPKSGLLCKGRLDKYDELEATLIDIKTCGQGAGPVRFAKTVAQRGYYIQLAHYVEIAELCGLPVKNVIFVAVETKPPYGVGVYSLPPEALEAGKRHRRMLLDVLERCTKLDDWPTYEDEIRPLMFDRWSFSFVEDSLTLDD